MDTNWKSSMKTYPLLFYAKAIIVECVSCFVHGLDCVWCVFQGWDIGTLGNTLSGCITQYPRVSPLELGLCYPPYSPCLLGCTAVLSSLHSGVVFNSSKLTLIFTRPHLGYGQYGLTHLISGYEPVGTTVQIMPDSTRLLTRIKSANTRTLPYPRYRLC